MNGIKREKTFVKEVTLAIHKLDPDAFIRKLHSSIYGSGLPDVVLISHSRSYWIEFKRPGGRLSGQQRSTLTDIAKAGGVAFAFAATSRSTISVLAPPKFKEVAELTKNGDEWTGLSDLLGITKERVTIEFP